MLFRLRALGAGVALSPGAMEHGTVRVQGFRNTARDAVPTVVLGAEHYNMLVRMVQAGASPQLRIEVGAGVTERIQVLTQPLEMMPLMIINRRDRRPIFPGRQVIKRIASPADCSPPPAAA
jgi:hypothetical protein